MESQSLFSFQSFGTIGGATLAVVVASNTYRSLTKSDSVYAPFIVSVAVSLISSFTLHTLNGFPGYILALLNACLLFCTALGLNQSIVGVAQNAKKQPGDISAQGRKNVRWLSPWITVKKE